jgi:hypothetical protein
MCRRPTPAAPHDGVEAAESHLTLTPITRIAEDPGLADLAVLLAGFAFRTAAADNRSICFAMA